MFKVSSLAEKMRLIKASAIKRPCIIDHENKALPIYFGHDLDRNQMARKKAKEYGSGIKMTIDKWNCRIWIAGTEILVNPLPLEGSRI
jgi:hypothetical protein